MKTTFLLGLALAMVTAGLAAAPFQRPIEPSKKDGWVRVALDASAQSALVGAWVGDDKGAAVPFQQISLSENFSQNLSVENPVIGRDEKGLLTAEFHLKGGSTYQASNDTTTVVSAPVADAPKVADSGPTNAPEPAETSAIVEEEPTGKRMATLSLNVEASSPWVAEVRVERRKKGGAWLALSQRWQIYDFGSQGQKTEISVPWDANEWRLRLVPVQGKLKALRSVEASGAKAVLPAPRSVIGELSNQGNALRLNLGAMPVQVVGFEVELSGVVAPIDPQIQVERVSAVDPKKMDYDYVGTSGLLWRMPGLKSNSSQLELRSPTVGNVFLLTLPENAKVEKVQALVREDQLLFVAEAGKNYFLHLGGMLKKAPGDLSGLPDTGEQNEAPLLTLRSSEADPFGIPFKPEWTERLKPFLPWVVGVAVVLLSVLAWRVVRQKPEDAA